MTSCLLAWFISFFVIPVCLMDEDKNDAHNLCRAGTDFKHCSHFSVHFPIAAFVEQVGRGVV